MDRLGPLHQVRENPVKEPRHRSGEEDASVSDVAQQVPLVDYLVASELFGRRFTSRDEPRRAIEALGKLAPCAVITLGENGLIWRKGDASGEVPAFSVPALDTTGAGDVFHGALALGIARSMQFQALLRDASAAAALACMKVGARTGIPRGDELDDFLSAAGYYPE